MEIPSLSVGLVCFGRLWISTMGCLLFFKVAGLISFGVSWLGPLRLWV